jgi:hypothetical protein
MRGNRVVYFTHGVKAKERAETRGKGKKEYGGVWQNYDFSHELVKQDILGAYIRRVL